MLKRRSNPKPFLSPSYPLYSLYFSRSLTLPSSSSSSSTPPFISYDSPQSLLDFPYSFTTFIVAVTTKRQISRFSLPKGDLFRLFWLVISKNGKIIWHLVVTATICPLRYEHHSQESQHVRHVYDLLTQHSSLYTSPFQLFILLYLL